MNRAKQLIISFIICTILVLLPCSDQWLHRGSHSLLRPLPPPPAVKEKAVLDNQAYWIALRYLRAHWAEFRNRRYMTIIDYTKPSSSKRLYLINLQSGEVRRCLVSHGRNSGWAYATRFSNSPGSFQSSKGFFRTGSVYSGKLGTCLELHGLERGINDNALSRGIVMHGAHYAGGRSIVLNRGRLGRSLGCPAVPMEEVLEVIDKIKNGSLVYVHAR
ncbi:MAG: murein L,D-transpeptidase catalytic domain family protein [Syntrophobacter sp.]